MIAFLDNVVTYISSVSSAGAFGTLSRQTLSPTPEVQTAVITDGDNGSTTPLHRHSLQLLVRDTDARTVAARAEGLHALFNNTWVTTCGLTGHFTAEHGPGPHWYDDAGLPVYSLNYRFDTVHTGL